MLNANIILINIFLLLLLTAGRLEAQNKMDTTNEDMVGLQQPEDLLENQNVNDASNDSVIDTHLNPNLEKEKKDYLFSLGVPLWYDFKTADDGERFKQSDVTYGVLLDLLIKDLGGIGFEYYEVPIGNNASSDNLEKNKIVFMMIDLIYLVKVPNPFNFAIGVGYGKSEVSGDNESSFKQGDCYQWFFRGGFNLNEIIQLHLGYHDVYSKIPFENNEKYGIEVGGNMFSGGISVAF